MTISLCNKSLPVARWTPVAATNWQRDRPWIVGCNFIPSTAGNQLEMWQSATFDSVTIDRELGWAAGLGMNVARVYLHDLLWTQDSQGFLDRIETYLAIAWRHGLKTMFVLFDSCWGDDPMIGPQQSPIPGVHNSMWLQSPGMALLSNLTSRSRLEEYVCGVVGTFSHDERVLAWDIWNEPDNGPSVNIHTAASLKLKADLVLPLLISAFGWARKINPCQMLTSPIWLGDWSRQSELTDIQQVQIACSDVISFHNYGDTADFTERVEWLSHYGRPLLCTEFLARTLGSTFEKILPIAHARHVGMLCWGLVVGKTQTHLPWNSPQMPHAHDYDGPWFHDVLHADGRPYLEEEALQIRTMARTVGRHASVDDACAAILEHR